ncbi:unnamed protein product [Clonostachys rosea]|uniref:PPPDE domain-containing protein n=1 Tax=Bionectria ochroleuca TaxID=29856 RepID=A0ABY6UFS1_BIOOC|nr:unnamed protein product [Clonostachys rosea]
MPRMYYRAVFIEYQPSEVPQKALPQDEHVNEDDEQDDSEDIYDDEDELSSSGGNSWYKSAKAGLSYAGQRIRPFQHARLVVTDPGQHQNGEPLDASSKGYIFDRNWAKSFQNSERMTLRNQDRKYTGLQLGYWSWYCGYTTLNLTEINQRVNDKIEAAQEAGEQYNLFTNNCEDFARSMAIEICQNEHIYRPEDAYKASRVSDPGVMLLVDSTHERNPTISEAMQQLKHKEE